MRVTVNASDDDENYDASNLTTTATELYPSEKPGTLSAVRRSPCRTFRAAELQGPSPRRKLYLPQALVRLWSPPSKTAVGLPGPCRLLGCGLRVYGSGKS